MTLAVADLDGDNLIDNAQLMGTGQNRSIQLRLSRFNRSSVLTFDTASLDRGSLFAQDVNDDGEIDLIWTDLVHPDNVVVWLNDGLGSFERARQGEYSGRFTLGGTGINELFERRCETAAGASRSFFGDLSLAAETSLQSIESSPVCEQTSQEFISTDLTRQPADRGPPNS